MGRRSSSVNRQAREQMMRWAEPTPAEVTTEKARRGKLRVVDVAWICAQLATTQSAGMPLTRALSMLAGQRAGSLVGDRIAELSQALSEGRSLSQAMRDRRGEYTELVIALLAAGESQGALEPALQRSSDLLTNRLRLRRKIRSAMLYPISVLVVTLVLVTVLLTVVVPKFEDIYAQSGGQLPAITRFVVAASAQAPTLIALILAAAGALAFILRRSRTDVDLRRKVDRFRFRIPVVGKLLHQAADARVASTLASLLGAGVSLLEALDYAALTANSTLHADALAQVKERIAEGSTTAAALERTGVFPDLMVQLVGVGEESGSLSELLTRYSAAADEQVEASANGLTTLIEPIMMVTIGVVVGIFLLALYLPIISVGSQIK